LEKHCPSNIRANDEGTAGPGKFAGNGVPVEDALQFVRNNKPSVTGRARSSRGCIAAEFFQRGEASRDVAPLPQVSSLGRRGWETAIVVEKLGDLGDDSQ
jgi:hypothetical protein